MELMWTKLGSLIRQIQACQHSYSKAIDEPNDDSLEKIQLKYLIAFTNGNFFFINGLNQRILYIVPP